MVPGDSDSESAGALMTDYFSQLTDLRVQRTAEAKGFVVFCQLTFVCLILICTCVLLKLFVCLVFIYQCCFSFLTSICPGMLYVYVDSSFRPNVLINNHLDMKSGHFSQNILRH